MEMSLLQCVFMCVFFLCFFFIPVTNAVGGKSRGQSSGSSSVNDEQLISIHEPLLGNLNRNHGSAIDGRIRHFVDEFNNDYLQYRKAVLEASWKYEKTKGQRNGIELDNAMTEYESFILTARGKLEDFDVKNSRIFDGKLKNQIQRINYLIRTTLPTDLRKKVESILRKADIVYHENTNATREILRNSQNSTELAKAWIRFVEKTGLKIKPLFGQHFDALKEIAKYHGFKTVAHFVWYKEGIFDSFNLLFLERRLHYKLYPLYTLLWYYFQSRLKGSLNSRLSLDEFQVHRMQIYEMGRINLHNSALKPFSGSHDVIRQAISEKPLAQYWIELANTYYHRSLGFDKLNVSEILGNWMAPDFVASNRPTVRNNLVVWNLFNGDYKIMYYKPNDGEDYLINIFNAVGYIHNLKIFQHLDPIRQDWTNEVFGEAIVGAIGLSVFSPSSLTRLGILSSSNVSESIIINRQLNSLIYHFSTLRLGMFTDRLTQRMYYDILQLDHYNSEWWRCLPLDLTIDSSLNRGYDFAAGTMEYLLHGTKYIKEIMSEVLKYQFFQHLCVVTGQFDPHKPKVRPLYRCDLHENEKAQKLIKFAMQQGNVLSWKGMMKLMFNSEKFDVEPMLNYFLPLSDWLKTVVDRDVIDLIAEKITGGISHLFPT